MEAQAALAEANSGLPESRQINFRIGVHVGDVMVRAGDLFGDGVNIAARLQTLARAGGLCVSGVTYDQVRKILPLQFTDLGAQTVKNIEEPIRAYEVKAQGDATPSALKEVSSLGDGKPLVLPDKPSIAVLPFQNMSGDPEQEYFADGMVEEIITALSRNQQLFVIARNSSFTFKGKAVDVKHVARVLGVRYILEGSVRKSGNRVRITGQLIDAASGAHLWADRFERDLTDVFALQDEVTVAVVSAIQPKVIQTEIAKATRRSENLTAYDFYLRAMQQLYLATRDGTAEVIRLAGRALELDPRFGLCAGLAAAGHMRNVIFGYAPNPEFDRKEAVRLIKLALSTDGDNPETLGFACIASAYMVGDSETEIENADRAVALNPNSFQTWLARGMVYKIAGQPEEAIRSFERAIRASPVDPSLHAPFYGIAAALIELGRFDEAIVAGKKSQRHNTSYTSAYRCLASAFAHLGRDAEAREAVAHLLETDPSFTISSWIARGGRSNDKLLIEGLRKAGLPE
jgi:adenylate cyclase